MDNNETTKSTEDEERTLIDLSLKATKNKKTTKVEASNTIVEFIENQIKKIKDIL